MVRFVLPNAQRITHNDKTHEKIVKRCVLTVALEAALVLAAFCFPSLCVAEAPVMKTLSAHVVKVAADEKSIDVDFKHPATGEVHRWTFFVDGQTGLSKLKTLSELRAGQIVNIDYVEGEKKRLLIRRIARVKLSGPPPGLEKFRGL